MSSPRRRQQRLPLVRDAKRISNPPLLPGRRHTWPVVVDTTNGCGGGVWDNQSRKQIIYANNDTRFSKDVGVDHGRDVAGVAWSGVVELLARYRRFQRAD